MLNWFLLGLLLAAGLGLLLYWLLIVTEGVYLGRRIVVWMYDLTAHRYDRIKQFDGDAERFLVIRPLLGRLLERPAPLVLDVATGTGRLPAHLLDEPTFNGRVIGLDASARMLSQAWPKLSVYHHRANLVQQIAVDLPFANGVFDAVSCLEALEFFPDDTLALLEMVRVLRPGGTLLVTRRRGWEAKTFVGRYRDQETFEALLSSLGLIGVESRLWQIEYDLVFARKPEMIKD
jgi:ubiquinone/menaquinone biosynthesis C-methylase UbiE